MFRRAVCLAVTTGAMLGSAYAADIGASVQFSADHRTAYALPHAAGGSTPYFMRKPRAATIYSNLATAYPKGLYYPDTGSTIFAGSGGSQFVAAGFTPTADATAVEVQVAVGNFGDRKDKYVLSIASDNAGVPGHALTGRIVTAQTAFGACCGLIVGRFNNGLKLKAGTPYWVTVTLNSAQQAAMNDGAWMLATTDEIDQHPFAFNPNNTGWVSSPTTTPPAFGVFSK